MSVLSGPKLIARVAPRVYNRVLDSKSSSVLRAAVSSGSSATEVLLGVYHESVSSQMAFKIQGY